MLAVTALVMLCQLATVPTPTQVALPDGPVNCALTGNRTRQCLALPYAQPPLEELRWSPPQPPKPWTAVRDATRQMDACYQRGRGVSEDCLYLNVFAPRMLPPASSPGRVANNHMCCLASALSNFQNTLIARTVHDCCGIGEGSPKGSLLLLNRRFNGLN